jgi:hypothetical protein
MKRLSALAVLMMFAVLPETAGAQTTTQVTVRVPVILTQLAPDVKSVRVSCNMISNELTNATNGNQLGKSEDITVVGGEVLKVVTLVFAVSLQNPVGKTASVGCWLEGWSASEYKFYYFREDATNPAFRTTPSVPTLQTSWVW